MNVRNFSLVLALVVFSSSSAFGQTFFWSDLGFGGGATANEAFSVDVEAGSSNQLFLYYRADGVDLGVPSGGLDFDFGWSQDGIASFTGARTDDFDVGIPGVIVFGPRWGDFAGDASNVTANAVEGFLTVNVVAGQGLGAANDGAGAVLDEGFDASAGAFLIGSIDYDAVGGPGPANSTQLVVDSSLIVSGADQVTANGFTATINIQTADIPEPTSAGLLALGLVGLVARRRR